MIAALYKEKIERAALVFTICSVILWEVIILITIEIFGWWEYMWIPQIALAIVLLLGHRGMPLIVAIGYNTPLSKDTLAQTWPGVGLLWGTKTEDVYLVKFIEALPNGASVLVLERLLHKQGSNQPAVPEGQKKIIPANELYLYHG